MKTNFHYFNYHKNKKVMHNFTEATDSPLRKELASIGYTLHDILCIDNPKFYSNDNMLGSILVTRYKNSCKLKIIHHNGNKTIKVFNSYIEAKSYLKSWVKFHPLTQLWNSD
jgi:hypothetical protein